ncbi:Uncharacterised protein [Vibrio cholerae]|nr:Uncharacterised protein [Vibrio cholerae]CSD01506.1 Uncharacterised protein [Vibrio cholerae]
MIPVSSAQNSEISSFSGLTKYCARLTISPAARSISARPISMISPVVPTPFSFQQHISKSKHTTRL